MEEQWKDIPGYERLYQASTLGRIRTCDGKVTKSAWSNHRVWKQRIMKQKACKNSHGRIDQRVELWKDGTHKTWLVSRLVALTWCDGYKEGFTVNHIDGNPMNNYANNLEWLSLKDNINHGFENELIKTSKKCILINKNGYQREFRSQSLASRYLGKNSAYIANCKKNNKPIISSNGEKYSIKFI